MIFFLYTFTISTDIINQSAFLYDDIVEYMQYSSQNIFIEKSISRLYFTNHDNFKSLYDYKQANLKEDINALSFIADENNDPDLYFLLSTLLYFGSYSIEPNISLSYKYLLKASSMNHSLAQLIKIIFEEDEKGELDTNSFNQLYSDFNLNRRSQADKNNLQFPYQQFYIANVLYYDYLENMNLNKCLNILHTYGIEKSNLHLIPNERSNSSCYKVYKMFRKHKKKEAMNMIRSLGNKLCFDEFSYYDKKPIDDPFIVAYYISKYNCNLGVEFIRDSLQNHEALRILLKKATEMEKQQNLLYSLKLFQILSHFGIELAIEKSIQISKILNLNAPSSILKMKKLNDQIKNEKCIDDLAAAINFRKDLLTSMSYLKHAIKLIPQSIFIAYPFRIFIIFMNFFNSDQNSVIKFNIFNVIRNNIEFSIFCLGIFALAFLVKLRVELLFITS